MKRSLPFTVKPMVTSEAGCTPRDGTLYCTCGGQSNPPFEIFWTKSPSPVVLSSTDSLNVTVMANTSGQYNCHMKNNHGESISSHVVTTLSEFCGFIIGYMVVGNLGRILASLILNWCFS